MLSTHPRYLATTTITLHLALIGLAAPARGQTQTDQRLWAAVVTQGRLRTGSPWQWTSDTLVRARDGVRTMDSAAARVVISRGVTRTSSAGIGYAYGTGFLDSGGTRGEHRLHQQFVWTGRTAGRRLSLRSRLEERIIEGSRGVRLRVRQQARVAWSLGSTRLQAVAYEEVFINATGTGGASRGLDSNRVFTGIRQSLTPRSAVEIGYLNLYAPNVSGPGRHVHIFSMVLAVSLQ